MIEIILGLIIGTFLGLMMYLLKSELMYLGITLCIILMSLANFVWTTGSTGITGGHPGITGGSINDDVVVNNNALKADSVRTSGHEKKYKDFPTNYFDRDDSKHKKIPTNYSKEVMQILKTGRFFEPVSHYTSTPEKSKTFSRILDLSKTMPYKRSRGEYKPQLHWGQLKLFLSEVEFLTKVMEDADSKGKKEIVFVYAGAAPGDHTKYLASLFPTIKFELYDPNKFIVKDGKMIKTHVQFFLNVDAQEWADYAKKHPESYIAFCSDIRSEPATEENVERNMTMQREWWEIINPDLTMFKFRLPWNKGTTEYPEGDIYIQLYPGATSTETRLIIKKNAKMIKYDNEQYESALFYHNRISRSKEYTQSSGIILDKCYDCMGFEYIMSEYLKLGLIKKPLHILIRELQTKISTGNKNIKVQTIRQISKELDRYYRDQYENCGSSTCFICPAGGKTEKIRSVATIENEELARKLRTVVKSAKSPKKVDKNVAKSPKNVDKNVAKSPKKPPKLLMNKVK